MTIKRFVAVATILLGAGSCDGRAGGAVVDGGEADSESSDPCANMACRPTTTVSWTSQGRESVLDLLIVVDDRIPSSPFAARYAKTMQALADSVEEHFSGTPSEVPNIHIALVTSNQPTTPMPLWPESEFCQKPMDAFLHISSLCEAPNNFQGLFADILACANANVFPSGSPSRPLETLHTLLGPGGLAETTGFRRPEAPLLLAVISSEDDPALADTSAQGKYRDFFYQLIHGDTALIFVSVVAPRNAKGLHDFTRSLWSSYFFDELEADTWSGIPKMAEPVNAKRIVNCLEQVDLGASTLSNEPKPTCLVRRRDTSPGGHSVERFIPECVPGTSTETTCWRAVRDEIMCRSTGIRLVNEDPPTPCRSPDVITYTGTCATAQ